MKVILLSDVKNVGKKGDMVDVSDGYGRNFLIRRGLAVAATSTSVDVLKEQKAKEAEEKEEMRQEALALAKQLETMELVFKVNAKNGKVFNSVSPKKIEEALAEKGIKIDKRKMIDTQPLSTLGYNHVKVELYKGVIGTIRVKLVEE